MKFFVKIERFVDAESETEAVEKVLKWMVDENSNADLDDMTEGVTVEEIENE